MFSPIQSDTSHISSSGPSISIIPKNQRRRSMLLDFQNSSIEDIEEEDSNETKTKISMADMSASDRVEQSRE